MAKASRNNKLKTYFQLFIGIALLLAVLVELYSLPRFFLDIFVEWGPAFLISAILTAVSEVLIIRSGGAVYFPPTLADLDGDGDKEIITGTRNGTVYAYELSGNTLSEKWAYYLEERKASGGAVDKVNFNGGSAVVDIDLDGDMGVIIADVFEGDDDWPGKVYVLEKLEGDSL